MRTHASGGSRYFVTTAPREGLAGTGETVLVFTDQETGVVLTARVPDDVDLEWITASELDEYLAVAR